MILRYRRADSVERVQLKWLFYPLAFGIISTTLYFLSDVVFPNIDDDLRQLWWSLSSTVTVISIPITIGIAILRHRLFDIDIIIRRTLIYGGLVAGLGVLYVAGVTLLQLSTQVFTGPQSDIVLVITTLAIATLFNPVRQRIQTFIDLRFYRAKVDFKVAFTNFAREVRSLIDLDELLSFLVERTTDLLKISHGAVYLLDGDESFRLAQQRSLPDGTMALDLSSHNFEQLTHGETISKDDDLVFPLLVPLMAPQPTHDDPHTYEERLIGVLALGPRLSDQVYTREDEVLLTGLADQAGTAIYVAQLIEQQREEAARREAYLNSPSGRAERKAQELLQTPNALLVQLYEMAQRAGGEPEIGVLMPHLPRALQALGEPQYADLAESYYYLLSSPQSPELLTVGIRQLEQFQQDDLVGGAEAQQVYTLCRTALVVPSIASITRLQPAIEAQPESEHFSGLVDGLKGLLPAAEALHAFERVDSTQDSLAYLASAVERLNNLDRVVRNELGSADRPIMHRIIENWLAVVTGSMSELQTRAQLGFRLLTRHTSQGDIVSLVLNVQNNGRGAALNIKVALEATPDYALLDDRAVIDQLATSEETQVELRVRPDLNEGTSQFRARFVITYDDPRGPDRVEHFADVVQLLVDEGEFQFVPNPYVVGTPLQPGSPLFYGREDLFAFIEENLMAAHHNTLVLIGQRRTGKSSFLKQLQLRLGEQYLPIYLDGQSIALDPGLPSFFYTLATEITFGLEDRGFSLPLPTTGRFRHQFRVTV